MESRTLVRKTDSYKVGHWLQQPPGTKGTYYYIEARGGKNDKVLFFGLQAIIKKILSKMPTVEEVEKADKFWTAHGVTFNKQGWLELIELGYYPLEIKAVEEGKLVKTGEVQVTIESTNESFYWLPGWIETCLLRLWYTATVASKQFYCQKVIYKYLMETGSPEEILWKKHSFGYRGVSSEESAELGGMSELILSCGTDTVAGIFSAQEYYNTKKIQGFSINASEHSTITSWGREFEVNAYKNMLDKFLTKGTLVACVSDSYNLSKAITQLWGIELKEQIVNSGGTLIVRPDSGDNPSCIVLRSLNELGDAFGYEFNSKGYKVLPNCIRLIQGEKMEEPENFEKILQVMKDNEWSADNVAFGSGAGAISKIQRNDYGYVMKMSAININGEWKNVYKEPADAPGKASKKGRFDYLNLPTVWKDGKFIKEYTFEQVRENAMSELIA